MSSEKSSSPVLVRTFKSREGVLETIMPPRITDDVLNTVVRDMEKLRVQPVWLVDAMVTDGFATSVLRLTSGTVLPRLEKAGLKRIVAIIRSPGVRMATRAVALASSIDIKVVESRLEATPLLAWKA